MSTITSLLQLVNGALRPASLSTSTLVAQAFGTASTNPAATGFLMLSNSDTINFRNSGNTADLQLGVGSTDGILAYNLIDLVNISSSQTLTNKTISGSSNTITNIPNSATTAVSTNTASTIVTRDSSGNFSAGTITANLTGHASLDLPLSGGTMSGAIVMGANKITGLAAPTANGDALRYDMLGANGGIATLDGGGKIPVAQLPNSVMTYEGTFDASSAPATPLLNGDSAANAGMVYLASVAGSYNFGAGAITFAIGDWAVYNGSIWEKSTNSNSVVSVNGQSGVVTIDAINQLTGDVTTSAASGSQSIASTVAKIQGTVVSGTTGTGNVVFSASPTFTGTVSGITKTMVSLGNVDDVQQIPMSYLDTDGTLAADSDTKVASQKAIVTYVTNAVSGSTVTAGSGINITSGVVSTTSAPIIQAQEISNDALSASTLYALRYMKSTDAGYTAGRMTKADFVASTNDNFYVIGLTYPSGAVSSGGNVTVVEQGIINVPAHGYTIGAPLFLGSAGALTSTPTSTSGNAVVRVGIVKDANNINVNIAVVGIN